jgi:hypothetical protein
MANIKELIQSIESIDSSFDEKLEALNQMEETLVAMRQQEQEAIDDNVDLIVEAINVMQKKVDAQLVEIQGMIPEKGDKGDKGLDGKQGKDGRDGKDGKDGVNGKDGADGKDGVSVTDAKIDFDGSLVITLSTGQEINVGEVVAPELQEKIKLVTSGGAGTVLPNQSGNANKYLKTDGSVLSWATVSGGSGTVTSVAATAGTGISITGSPITTSGTLNITNTAPDQTVALTGAGTTSITGTYPNFTITSNDSATGTVTSVAALTLGTTGTNLSSSVATGTTTPVITLNVPTASATNRGALSSADWTTFNNKGSGTVTSVAATVPSFLSVTGSPITTSGTLAVALASTPTNGQLLIGNGTEFSYANLTAGSNITITNSSGGITIASSGGGSSLPITKMQAQSFGGF